jgi:hypothetical protein
MTRRRKTDGERIAEKTWERIYLNHANATWDEEIARDIDRLIRRRMAEAWEEGWCHKTAGDKWDDNPYRGRRRKK